MSDKAKKVRVVRLVREGSGYGFVEFEMSEDFFQKNAKQLDACTPDIFAIFLNNLTKKCRELFEI